MTGSIRPQDLIDSTVVDSEGSKIGKVGTVYLADDTQQAEWVTVKTGLFGQKESFVPLSGANFDDDGVHVNVGKDQVTDAPRIDAEGHLSQEESVELYRYYGLRTPGDRRGGQQDQGQQAPAETGATGQERAGPDMQQQQQQPGTQTAAGAAGAGGLAGTAAAGTRGADTGTTGEGTMNESTRTGEHAATDERTRAGERTGQHAQSGDESMVRSEEQLKVDTQRVESGHVRLRKYVVTEQQQITVPVSHEEVRLEREPITESGGSTGQGTDIGEQEQDVVLHAEKPVVEKESVPVERVRMNTETVTEEQTISGEVRKEQVDMEDTRGSSERGAGERSEQPMRSDQQQGYRGEQR